MYMTHELRFIDSFKFMASGMDKLVSNITACGKCKSCCPEDCLKEYEEEGSIRSCGKCKNCLLLRSHVLSLPLNISEKLKRFLVKKLISLHGKVYIRGGQPVALFV